MMAQRLHVITYLAWKTFVKSVTQFSSFFDTFRSTSVASRNFRRINERSSLTLHWPLGAKYFMKSWKTFMKSFIQLSSFFDTFRSTLVALHNSRRINEGSSLTLTLRWPLGAKYFVKLTQTNRIHSHNFGPVGSKHFGESWLASRLGAKLHFRNDRFRT